MDVGTTAVLGVTVLINVPGQISAKAFPLLFSQPFPEVRGTEAAYDHIFFQRGLHLYFQLTVEPGLHLYDAAVVHDALAVEAEIIVGVKLIGDVIEAFIDEMVRILMGTDACHPVADIEKRDVLDSHGNEACTAAYEVALNGLRVAQAGQQAVYLAVELQDLHIGVNGGDHFSQLLRCNSFGFVDENLHDGNTLDKHGLFPNVATAY